MPDLTDDQRDVIIFVIKQGREIKDFTYQEASICEALDSIVEFVSTEAAAETLFGVNGTHGNKSLRDMTPEEVERAIVHWAMHWAFALGAGTARVIAAGAGSIPPSNDS